MDTSKIISGFALLVSLGALYVSWYSFERTNQQTRYNLVSQNWYTIELMGLANPKFIDKKLTRDYKKNFKGSELLKYDTFARVSVAYIEELYITDLSEEIYYQPTVNRHLSRHTPWVCDNRADFQGVPALKRKIEKICDL